MGGERAAPGGAQAAQPAFPPPGPAAALPPWKAPVPAASQFWVQPKAPAVARARGGTPLTPPAARAQATAVPARGRGAAATAWQSQPARIRALETELDHLVKLGVSVALAAAMQDEVSALTEARAKARPLGARLDPALRPLGTGRRDPGAQQARQR